MEIPEPVRTQAKAELATAYSRVYDEYKNWEDAAKTLHQEQETEKAQTAHRMACNISHRLVGFRMASEALGIPTPELLEAVREIGKGGDTEWA